MILTEKQAQEILDRFQWEMENALGAIESTNDKGERTLHID